MTETIIVALITAAATIGAQLIISARSREESRKQHDKTLLEVQQKQDKTVALIEQRLDQIEKKQDKHNGLIERMTKVEASAKSAHKRIDEIHHEHWEEE